MNSQSFAIQAKTCQKPHQVAFLPTLLAGLMVGIDNIGASLAIASLLFSGALAMGLQLGIQTLLLSSAVMAVGLRSAQPNAIGLVQETGVAILSVALLTMCSNMEISPGEARVATALAIIGAASLATGLLCIVVGRLRLGGFARFIPFPVVAGFLAGSGWMLVEGALAMLTGAHANSESQRHAVILYQLTDPDILGRIGAAFLFAGGLMALLRRSSHPMIIPGFLVVSGAAFYLVLFLSGQEIEQVRLAGWLPQSMTSRTETNGLDWAVLVHRIDWLEVFVALPSILSVAFLNLLGTLLNTSGLELATRRDLDANLELKRTGVANLLVAPFGGASGFLGLGVTLLAERMGATSRWAGVAAALVTALGLLFTAPLVGAMPVFLTSGIVLFLGLELLKEWLLDTRNALPPLEWVVVLLVVLVTALAGFIDGLALGLVMATILFVINYARLPIVRVTVSGKEQRSSVERSMEANRYLQQHGEVFILLQIQGYLFFGSTIAIVDKISQRLSATAERPLRYVILDMQRVQGADSSAMACFAKIRNLAEGNGFHVFFSHLAPELLRLFHNSGLKFVEGGVFSQEPDLEHALERCEEYLLIEAHQPLLLNASIDHHFVTIMGPHPRIPDMIKAMERLSFPDETLLIRRGDPAESIYFLESGSVTVSVVLPDGCRLLMRTMTSGAIMGDLALYLKKTRTADVITCGQVVVYRLQVHALEYMEIHDPTLAILFHRLLARSLSDKVVSTTGILRIFQR
ncbi:MAG: cyclic nucleotide-binding domain-containing protein [Magnetococcales bacterium]|nr:cyclic nucleotide-binding domain-containing protein [Magnetococcales bacterium]